MAPLQSVSHPYRQVAHPLFSSLESNFPLTVLLTFASEGDNRGDALRLVEYLNEWAQLVKLT